MATSSVNPSPARVILLCGPSGSGKSTLAERAGLPVLQLDDFYKDGDDPTLPRLHDGSVDWDDPQSWHFDQAVAAIRALCATGTTEVPVYSIPANGRVDSRPLSIGSPVFIAEGIFAAEIVRACAAEGLLADAICLRNHALTTAYRRFLRDVREARKSVPYLLRRGFRLMRAERAVVTRQEALGATPCNGRDAFGRISKLHIPEGREALPMCGSVA
ncbi:uridine kinase family protein [Streptacidiphilus fuscans]|uniref:uridine kinase family protein n=1 Tax=Streptacidiphilus fuscans TaxID=2789292 RepID=UPI002E2D197F|nr:ATP-binding protein [Streptacidiphilus fuscans]